LAPDLAAAAKLKLYTERHCERSEAI